GAPRLPQLHRRAGAGLPASSLDAARRAGAMTSWQAVRAGARDLRAWPAVNAAAILAGLTATLAGRAATRKVAMALAAAGSRGAPESLGLALATLLVGGALATLLLDLARAGALCAYAAPSPARPCFSLRPLWQGVMRVPAMITVGAVEAVIY